MIWPVAGRDRQRHIPLASSRWRLKACWQMSGRRRTTSAGTRVSNICWGDEAWLIGEHRLSGICLANVPAKTDLHTFSRHHQSAMVMRARSPADKKRPGLDHFDADHGKAFIVMSS
jgi:hypothetical protein